MSFLLEHWSTWAPLGALGLGLGVAALVLGPAILLNRWVLAGLGVVAALTLLALAYEKKADALRAEGAAEKQRANDAAKTARYAAISEYVVAHAQRETEDQARARLAEQRLDLERDERQRERKAAYAKADLGCVVPLRFVRDHDAGVPRPGGRPDVPRPDAGDLDAGSGVPLSAVAEAVDVNYSSCQKLLDRVRGYEERRYRDCLEWDAKFGTRSGCAP